MHPKSGCTWAKVEALAPPQHSICALDIVCAPTGFRPRPVLRPCPDGIWSSIRAHADFCPRPNLRLRPNRFPSVPWRASAPQPTSVRAWSLNWQSGGKKINPYRPFFTLPEGQLCIDPIGRTELLLDGRTGRMGNQAACPVWQPCYKHTFHTF